MENKQKKQRVPNIPSRNYSPTSSRLHAIFHLRIHTPVVLYEKGLVLGIGTAVHQEPDCTESDRLSKYRRGQRRVVQPRISSDLPSNLRRKEEKSSWKHEVSALRVSLDLRVPFPTRMNCNINHDELALCYLFPSH